jgi:hypothetical protein
LLPRHAGANPFLDQYFDVATYFLVEFLFDSFFAEEGSQSSDEISEDTHQISLGVAFRMRAMAALWVSHPRVSAFSLLRPSADKM